MDSLFIGKFRREKGEAESPKWPVIQVTRGFLKGEFHGWGSLVPYLVVLLVAVLYS